MERDSTIDNKRSYESLRELAMKSAELRNYELSQKILTIMIKIWPERVIAKGELASNTNVSDSNLDTPVTIP
jgi:hypothetical protein